MSVLKKKLEVSNTNVLSSYFPARTSVTEGAFDWDIAKGVVVRNLYKKQVAKSIREAKGVEDKVERTVSLFKDACKSDFIERLDEPEVWAQIEQMYFSGETVHKIAPESLLLRLTGLSGNSPKHRLADMFSSLMQAYYVESPKRIKRNFIEQQVVDTLRSARVLEAYEGRRLSKGINEKPYLPFLTEYFKKDLQFLSDHPRYLIDNLEELLKLYGYLYTSQLALNIQDWRRQPSSKPLYFIMENETASKERSDLTKNGHQRVADQLEYLFPFLTVSESLQSPDVAANEHRLPLWMLAEQLVEDDAVPLKEYAKAFALDRNKDGDYSFPYELDNQQPKHWLEVILQLSHQQFGKKSTRSAANKKFIKSTEDELCATFVKNRGQAGKILVMNQDYLMLLTNIAIGKNHRMRLYELLQEFNARGVYFDKKTQQALIHFYERVGNVERMSDSGDAVYVRKTV